MGLTEYLFVKLFMGANLKTQLDFNSVLPSVSGKSWNPLFIAFPSWSKGIEKDAVIH